MSGKKQKPYRKGRKADYQGATPKQVTWAVLQYRPPQTPVRHTATKQAKW